MRSNILLTVLVTFLASLALAAQPERTVDVHIWPLHESKSHSLAKVTYTSNNATVKSFTPPKDSAEDQVVRVGFHNPSGSWSGVATSASNFSPAKDKKIQLHLNKPVVLNAEGKLPDKEPEKSFLQKYWWVIGAVLVFQVVMSSGKE